MSYHHFTTEERENLLVALTKNLSVREIAHPSSPWEKPTVENTNGLIRQYFPKRTSFDDVTEERIKAVTDKLNSRPRKVLGWLSPERVFNCCI